MWEGRGGWSVCPTSTWRVGMRGARLSGGWRREDSGVYVWGQGGRSGAATLILAVGHGVSVDMDFALNMNE